MTYLPFLVMFFVLYILLLGVTFLYIQFFVVATAFEAIGISPEVALIVLLLSLLCSSINIPIFRMPAEVPVKRKNIARYLGVRFRVPEIAVQRETVIAVNLGGAIIPLLISGYLLITHPQVILSSLLTTLILSVMVYSVSRPVPGAGIVVPLFIPPIAAALLAWGFSSGEVMPIVAYISGTLGTLVGADLYNLRRIPELGSPVASIGGAGTFDGIFLSGIIAVLLASL